MLHGLTIEDAIRMGLQLYFERYARRVDDAPEKYQIRIGGKILTSDDTHDLMGKLRKYVRDNRSSC